MYQWWMNIMNEWMNISIHECMNGGRIHINVSMN